MYREELTRVPAAVTKVGEDFKRCAFDDKDFAIRAICEVDKCLLRIQTDPSPRLFGLMNISST